MTLGTWWAWAIAAILLAFGEVILPGYVLLGFAIGAGAMAGIFYFGGPLAVWLAGSIPFAVLGFAVISLISWLVLRRVLGVYKGQVTNFDRDINDD